MAVMDISGRSAARIRAAVSRVDVQELAVLGGIVILAVALLLGTEGFGTSQNLSNVLYSASVKAIIGIGMTLAIVSGNIDISVGSATGLIAAIMAKVMLAHDVPFVILVLIGLVIGALLGCVNGFLVAVLRINPIIATFATLNIFAFGKQYVFGNDSQLLGVPSSLRWLGAPGQTLGIPHAWWIVVVLMVVAWLYMECRPNGRHLYAIGNSSDAARVAGVRVQRRVFGVYVVVGLCVGLAACCLVGSNSVVDVSFGSGFELDVIAGVVIGGTLIFGGRGTVFGTVLGTLLVALVANAVILFGLPSGLFPLVTGIAIIVAVMAGVIRERRRAAA